MSNFNMSHPSGFVKIPEMLRPRDIGVLVNAHIVQGVREIAPDYEAMRQLATNRQDGAIRVHDRADTETAS